MFIMFHDYSSEKISPNCKLESVFSSSNHNANLSIQFNIPKYLRQETFMIMINSLGLSIWQLAIANEKSGPGIKSSNFYTINHE